MPIVFFLVNPLIYLQFLRILRKKVPNLRKIEVENKYSGHSLTKIDKMDTSL